MIAIGYVMLCLYNVFCFDKEFKIFQFFLQVGRWKMILKQCEKNIIMASSPDNAGDFAQLLMSAAVRPGREPDGMSRGFWPDTYEMLAVTVGEKRVERHPFEAVSVQIV